MVTKSVCAPTLRTIRMVEETLQEESLMTVAELKRRLPRKVNHNTLKEILLYLEESGKIYSTVKGITYLTPMTPEFRARWGPFTDARKVIENAKQKHK